MTQERRDVLDAGRYRSAGVDIDAGQAFVHAIGPLVRSTARAGANPELKGFAGFFDLAAAGFMDPILVAATDGVGTKLQLTARCGRHKGAGIDLVAMCVNDLLVHGAQPLFFLDYLATSKLDPACAREVLEGIVEGCREAGCALIGGETAEMPEHYRPGDYDLAGFFDLAEAGFTDPILVAATDGVGTKVQLTARCGRHKVAGTDVVAMCVNDLLVHGAQPASRQPSTIPSITSRAPAGSSLLAAR